MVYDAINQPQWDAMTQYHWDVLDQSSEPLRSDPMPVNVTFTSLLKTQETLENNTSHQGSGSTVIAQLSTSLLNQISTSTPPCTLRAGADKALSSGAVLLDLTSLIGTNGVAVDGTGLRVQFAKFLNPSTNANPITIAVGTSNGYDGFGSALSVTLNPGAEIMIRTLDAGSDIGSSKKFLLLTGTGAQALSYEMVMG